MTNDKPYRPNVGIALFNAAGQVLIGRRFRDDGPEIILPGLEWQMPQGGIDAHENPRDAVMRELWEETGVVNADYLGETDWQTYEFRRMTGRHHIGWRNSAASARNGSRCVSHDPMTRSIP
jgi:putative (di)nucleoside polyphosphate hydrolase